MPSWTNCCKRGSAVAPEVLENAIVGPVQQRMLTSTETNRNTNLFINNTTTPEQRVEANLLSRGIVPIHATRLQTLRAKITVSCETATSSCRGR